MKVRRRKGFTLVELLVVIAIIGVLVALLLPAVQAAREAARRSQCKNNLKQLSLGALNQEDVQKHYPTGGWGWYWVGDPDRGFGKNQPGGWIYNTLPFMEQGALHDMGKDGSPNVATPSQRDAARTVLGLPLTIVTCPSRRPPNTFPYNGGGMLNALLPTVAGRSDYAANSGTRWVEPQWTGNPASEEFAASYGAQEDLFNASGNKWWIDKARVREGQTGTRELTGVIYQRSEVSGKHITDGTSNTYMVGEKALTTTNYETGSDQGDNETWCTGFNNDNFRVTALANPPASGALTALTPLPDAPSYPTGIPGERAYGSAHSGGVNMAFCDGSIRSVSFNVDWQVHRDLGDLADGNAVDTTSL